MSSDLTGSREALCSECLVFDSIQGPMLAVFISPWQFYNETHYIG